VAVAERFAHAGIPTILLKGPTLAKWLYDVADPRFYTDADVLVPASEMARAEEILVSLGFVCPHELPHDKPSHAHEWIRLADRAAIDLHRSLVGAGAPPGKVWDVLSGRTIPEDIAGYPVTCLDLEARALNVVLHAAAHGPANGKPIEDLRRVLQMLAPERWNIVGDLAQQLDALPAFALGLQLCEDGAEVAVRLSLREPPSVDAILRSSSAPPTSLGIDWLVRLPGWSKKATFLYHKFFPPREYMLARHPVARRGRLGLVRAYLWRPLWQLKKFGPALRGYVRARRAARRLDTP
jgi:hypothetical protein